MDANRALALEGRDRLASALGVAAPAPDAMLGSMAALVLPLEPDDAAAAELNRRLEIEDRIQVPVLVWPVPAARVAGAPARMLVRISAQRYNEPADYDRLAEALARRLAASTAAAMEWVPGGPPSADRRVDVGT